MAGRLDSLVEECETSRWQKLCSLIESIVMMLDPDPVEHTYTAIRTLRGEMALLESKVIELERESKRTA